jgi:hypothetical protein
MDVCFSEAKRSITKMSQKQRKRLLSESGKEPVATPATPTTPVSPWNKQFSSPTNSPGLQDIIKEEKKSAWGKSPVEEPVQGAIAIPSSSRQRHPRYFICFLKNFIFNCLKIVLVLH